MTCHTVLKLDSCWNLTSGNRKTCIKIGLSWALSDVSADKRKYTKQELPFIPAEKLRMWGMRRKDPGLWEQCPNWGAQHNMARILGTTQISPLRWKLWIYQSLIGCWSPLKAYCLLVIAIFYLCIVSSFSSSPIYLFFFPKSKLVMSLREPNNSMFSDNPVIL